jgi:hypothetical protein
MSLLSILHLQAAEGPGLPVSSVVFPIIALSVFLVLGVITWSYRDVANRHAARRVGSAQHGATQHGAAPHGPTH